MAANLRIGLRTRALAGLLAAAAASPLGIGGVATGRAATVRVCETQSSWVTTNTLATGGLAGQTLFIGPELCAVGAAQIISSPGYSYAGNCAEGTLSFSNGIGVFVGGILVAEWQSSAGVATLVAVGTPFGLPCTGGGSIIWGSPAGIEVDG